MRKRFCMVVALIVALSVPLRLSALAAEASEELPSELFLADGAEVSDLSWLSQTYSLGGSVMTGEIQLSFVKYSGNLNDSLFTAYDAKIQVGSQVYYFPSDSVRVNPSYPSCHLFSIYDSRSSGLYIFFGSAGLGDHSFFIETLWSFIALLCLCNGDYTFGGGGEEGPDYTAILNQISDKLNSIQSGNSSDFSEVSELLNQVISGNAAVQQAVTDMQSAMVDVITSNTAAVDNAGAELQQRWDDAMATLDEGLTAQGQAMQDVNDRLDSMESALMDSVGGEFKIDSSASGSVDSVGSEGLETISSMLDQMLSSFSWIAALVSVFLMIVLAKRILT